MLVAAFCCDAVVEAGVTAVMSTLSKKQDGIFLLHQGLVRAMAWRLHRRLGKNADIDDLVAYGQIGLLEAIYSFDETRGVKFATFAWYRVRGAIFDGLTKMSWFNRIAFEQGEYEIQNSGNSLKQEKQQLSPKKRAGTQDRSSLRGQIQPTVIGGFDGNIPGKFREGEMAIPQKELLSFLRDLVSALPEKEAGLIKARFFEGRTLTEAARRVGLSVSWASRLQARTLADLRMALENAGFSSVE